MRACFGLSLITMWFAVVGCENVPPPAPRPEPSPNVTTPIEVPPSPNGNADERSDDVNVEIKSWDETLALVAEHKGKVVVLDLWSTSCEPCIEEFPNLVSLFKTRGGDKLICLSASCDFEGLKNKPPAAYRPQVLEFLKKQGATFPNVLLNIEIDVLLEKIDLASIPAVLVFGPDGNLAKRFDNDHSKPGEEFTYAKSVLPFVESLLGAR